MEETQICIYQPSQYQIQQFRKTIQQLKQITTMSKKERSQLITKEFLQLFLNVLKINLFSYQFTSVSIDAILPFFTNLLTQLIYEFKQRGQIVFEVNLENQFYTQELIILLNGSVLKQGAHSAQINKNRKLSFISIQQKNQYTSYQFCKANNFHPNKLQRKKNQVYCSYKNQLPLCIWPTHDNYKIKTRQKTNYLRVHKSVIIQFQNIINQHQKDQTNYFLSKCLHIDIYYIKLFKLQPITKRKLIKRKQKDTLPNDHLYLIYKGYLQLIRPVLNKQKQSNFGIFLTQGSIINLQSMFQNIKQDIQISIQHQVQFFAINKEAILKIMEEYPWVYDQFCSMRSNLAQLRKQATQRKVLTTQQPQKQIQQQFKSIQLSDTAMQRFRKTIGIKKYNNRFRVNNNIKNSDCKQKINFISSFYPFARMVDSQNRIANRNIDQRNKREQINMLPQKDSKNYMALKRRIHDEKVKVMRVKKRAQEQIRQSKFLKTDFSDKRILQSALFSEYIHIPNLLKQKSQTKIDSTVRNSTILKKSSSNNFQDFGQFIDFQNTLPQQKQVKKYIIPIGISKTLSKLTNLSFKNQTKLLDLTSSQLNISDYLSNRVENKQNQVNLRRKSPEIKIIRKMASGKIRKINIIEKKLMKHTIR